LDSKVIPSFRFSVILSVTLHIDDSHYDIQSTMRGEPIDGV